MHRWDLKWSPEPGELSRITCLTCSFEVPAFLKGPAPKQALRVGMGLVIVQALLCLENM